jgi:hypothetical protein
LRGLVIGYVDMIGKIGDDALHRGAYFDLPAPVHDAAHNVYLREG